MKEKEQRQEQQMVPVMMMPQPMVDEDEINLLDLWRVLWQRKMIVLGTALAAAIMAVAYALLATSVYKAEAFLLPPSAQNVQGLNVQGLNVQGYTPEQVYDLFIRNLQSRALRRHYFDAHKLADALAPDREQDANINRIFEEDFNKMLSVSRDKKNKARVDVSYQGSDAKLAAQWVNDMVAEANTATVRTLAGDVASKLENSKRELREKIAVSRQFAEQRRMDRIAELEEAIHMAADLGIKEDPLLSQVTGKSTIAVNQMDSPLYMRGTRALQAEVTSMRTRKSDDPFIFNLRDLQEKLAKLDSIHIDPSKISAVQIDQAAEVPDRRIKPKRKLIVMLGLLGGLMLGIFAAFFAEFMDKARREQSSEAAA